MQRRRLLKAALALALFAGGCHLDMPLGSISAESDPTRDAGSNPIDRPDGAPEAECLPFVGCRVPERVPPATIRVGEPIMTADGVLHAGPWTFTALVSDTNGRLYSFFWWVAPSELGDGTVPVDHLAWRSRVQESVWTALQATPGVTAEELTQARCTSPSQGLVEFAATDDGYVHAFWRKNSSCRGADILHIEHAIFEDGQLVFRDEMPTPCSPGADLRMTDVLAGADGTMMAAFLCGNIGRLQRYSCGCWDRSTLVSGEKPLQVQIDLQLQEAGGEPWLVMSSFERSLYAQRLGGSPTAETYLLVSDGDDSPVRHFAFSDEDGALWVAWQPGTVPSVSVRVARLVGEGFEPATTLDAGAGLIYGVDAESVPGRGIVLVTEESHGIPAEDGARGRVRDELFAHWFVDGRWSDPVSLAHNEVEVDGPLPTHTASDLEVVADRAFLGYVTYVGGDAPYELRVVEVP